MLKKFPKFKRKIIPNKNIIIDDEEPKKLLRVLKQKRIKDTNNKDILLYLVRYKNKGAEGDEWLPAEKIPNSATVLRSFRASKRGIIS